MKKTVILILVMVCFYNLYAQERIIKMPESPSLSQNIAENDGGTFWCTIDISGGSTVMENKKNVALTGTSFIGGYRLNQYLKAGIGIGVLYYPNNNNVRDTKNHLSMPIFINLRGNFLSEETRYTVPYWSVNVGTSIPDGPFLTPSVGLRIGEKRNAFLVSIGYTLRHLKSYPDNINNYCGVLFKLGYEF